MHPTKTVKFLLLLHSLSELEFTKISVFLVLGETGAVLVVGDDSLRNGFHEEYRV